MTGPNEQNVPVRDATSSLGAAGADGAAAFEGGGVVDRVDVPDNDFFVSGTGTLSFIVVVVVVEMVVLVDDDDRVIVVEVEETDAVDEVERWKGLTRPLPL